MTMRLPMRLYLSYASVVVAGAATAFATTRLLAPRLFDERMAMMQGMGGSTMMGGAMGGPGVGQQGIRDAFTSSLTTALVVGLTVALVIAGVSAVLVTRRLLRPVDAVRAATRRIAAGDYQSRVPVPPEPEMAALAADVNTLAAGLAETEQRRTRLLGDVAHEMRTPLTALDGYVEGMIDGVFQPDAPTLDAVTAELRRLHRLADDLAALSRAQEHRFTLTPRPCDLSAIVHAAVDRLRPQFDDAQVRLSLQADSVLSALVDPDRVTQVLTNLLGNALVATPTHGRVEVSVDRDGERASIRVRDTGVGLTADDLTQVFERFYRAPGALRRSQGSGVGLTIAREIAHAHGGSLTAASDGRGRGATFTCTLPLHAAS